MLTLSMYLEATNTRTVRSRQLVAAPVGAPVGAQAVIETVLGACQEEASAGRLRGDRVVWWLHRDDDREPVVSGEWRPGDSIIVARALYAVL